MRNSLCSRIAALCFVSSVLLAPQIVSAGTGGPENPTGAPPFGVAIQRDAQGEKLIGVLFAEFFNESLPVWNGESFLYFADARVIVRLRKGAQFATFYGEASHVEITTPAIAQPALMGTIAEDVLAYFFPGDQGLSIKLKSITEYGQLDICAPLAADFNNCPAAGSTFVENTVVLADIVLAVK